MKKFIGIIGIVFCLFVVSVSTSSSVFAQDERSTEEILDSTIEIGEQFGELLQSSLEDIQRDLAYTSVTEEELMKIRQKVRMINSTFNAIEANPKQVISGFKKNGTLEEAITVLSKMKEGFSKLNSSQKEVFKYEGWETSKIETILDILSKDQT